MSSPSTHRRPASIFSRWLMQRRIVDLPPPLGPSSTNVFCGCTVMSMPLRTSSLPNDFHTCSACTMGRSAIARHPFQCLAFRAARIGLSEASSEVLLQVVLTDGEHGGERQIPDARDDEQGDLPEVLRVHLLNGREQIVARDDRD